MIRKGQKMEKEAKKLSLSHTALPLRGRASNTWAAERQPSDYNLSAALFLTDSKFLKLNRLPPLYQSILKSWAFKEKL